MFLKTKGKLFQRKDVNAPLLSYRYIFIGILTISFLPKNIFAEDVTELRALDPAPVITSINQSIGPDGGLVFSLKGDGFEAEGCTSLILQPPALSKSSTSNRKFIYSLRGGRFEVEGCTSVVIKPRSPEQKKSDVAFQPVVASEPAAASILVPAISSVRQSTASDGPLTIAVDGSGMDIGAVVEVYDQSGKYIGSGTLSGKVSSGASKHMVPISTPKKVVSGKYIVKVKNPNGQYSKPLTLVLRDTSKKAKQCAGSDTSSNEAITVLYLGGGNAKRLFERYLSQNSKIEDRLDYSIQIKLYEKEKGTKDFDLRTIKADAMRKAFFESKEALVDYLKKELNDKVAELPDTFIDDAKKEKADYYQCPIPLE